MRTTKRRKAEAGTHVPGPSSFSGRDDDGPWAESVRVGDAQNAVPPSRTVPVSSHSPAGISVERETGVEPATFSLAGISSLALCG
jgi:hypothetical protein